jgi:hypothetical protein
MDAGRQNRPDPRRLANMPTRKVVAKQINVPTNIISSLEGGTPGGPIKNKPRARTQAAF